MFGYPSRLAAVAMTGAAACLMVAGCSGGPSLLGSSPTATSVAPPNPAGPPADPFAGTPADHWADGAAGLVLPAAEPIAGFSKAQVEYAYQTTRKMLIAAELDPTTLHGGPPTAFADLLMPQDRTWFLDGLNKSGADKDGFALNTRSDIVSFAPGTTTLIGSVIKAHGSMSAKASSDRSELDVRVDYLFAYPVEPTGQPQNWTRVISEAAWVVSFGNWQGAASAFAPSFSTTPAEGVSGSTCQTKDGYVHPAYPDNAPQGASPSGKPLNPYATGEAGTGSCRAETGT